MLVLLQGSQDWSENLHSAPFQQSKIQLHRQDSIKLFVKCEDYPVMTLVGPLVSGSIRCLTRNLSSRMPGFLKNRSLVPRSSSQEVVNSHQQILQDCLLSYQLHQASPLSFWYYWYWSQSLRNFLSARSDSKFLSLLRSGLAKPYLPTHCLQKPLRWFFGVEVSISYLERLDWSTESWGWRASAPIAVPFRLALSLVEDWGYCRPTLARNNSQFCDFHRWTHTVFSLQVAWSLLALG